MLLHDRARGEYEEKKTEVNNVSIVFRTTASIL